MHTEFQPNFVHLKTKVKFKCNSNKMGNLKEKVIKKSVEEKSRLRKKTVWNNRNDNKQFCCR